MRAPMKSERPKKRPEMIGSSSGGSTRGIDPDENYGRSSPKKSMRPVKRPDRDIGASKSGGTRGIDPVANYGKEDVKKFAEGGKVKKTKKSFTGAQFYQSEDAKRERRAAKGRSTDTDREIDRALTDAVREGRLTAKEAGYMSADTFVDSVTDAYKDKPKKFNKGGMVRGCKSGQMSGKGFSGQY